MNDLKKLYKVSIIDYILANLFFIMLIIVGIVGLSLYGMKRFWIPILIGVIAILLIVSRINGKYKRAFKKLEKRGLLERAKNEFPRARPFLNEGIYFGESLIFGKYNGSVTEYSKIHKFEFVSSYSDQSNQYKRWVNLKCSDGEIVRLCGCSHKEADKLYEQLLLYNPHIQYVISILDPDPKEE